MKISELIEKLSSIQKARGDIPVFFELCSREYGTITEEIPHTCLQIRKDKSILTFKSRTE